jgi:hypothetical protein
VIFFARIEKEKASQDCEAGNQVVAAAGIEPATNGL